MRTLLFIVLGAVGMWSFLIGTFLGLVLQDGTPYWTGCAVALFCVWGCVKLDRGER